jgi:septation ring formation regulator EzrA
LLRAKSRFEKARDIARAKRDAMLKEVEGLQNTVDSRYQDLKAKLASARLSGALKKKLDVSLQEIEKTIQEAKSLVDGGDYIQARKSTESAMRLLFELRNRVN